MIYLCVFVLDNGLFCCDYRCLLDHLFRNMHNLRLNLPLTRFTFNTKLKPWVRLNLTYASENEMYAKLKPRSGISYTYATDHNYMMIFEQ